MTSALFNLPGGAPSARVSDLPGLVDPAVAVAALSVFAPASYLTCIVLSQIKFTVPTNLARLRPLLELVSSSGFTPIDFSPQPAP